MTVRPLLALIALGLLSAAGCGPAKLNENKTLTLDAGDAKGLDFPAISNAQTITIDFKSSAGEVSVYLFNEADAKGEDGLLTSDPKKALGLKKGKEGSFEVNVPEKTATRIIVRGANEKTTVTLKATNAK
ncbi:hypothetical protein [Frigoriglobus tundricola]|uniref:Uncharacterized protein n=1 Tax=Frigoriglobus tundricola TaxID=2774151 RepID=A0A6M5Z0J5_9BACT|nr:hypothetical protein [Frigoriglobus tundricola]QJW98973.1 hypothetical protein FTUN_6568 [Frigoriglobus tundricola]